MSAAGEKSPGAKQVALPVAPDHPPEEGSHRERSSLVTQVGGPTLQEDAEAEEAEVPPLDTVDSKRFVDAIEDKGAQSKFAQSLLEPTPGKHRTYYWVPTKEQHEQDPIDVKIIVDEHGVPEHVLLHHISEELDEEAAVKSLPSALILVLLYALMNLAHDTQASVRSVEEAFTSDITENGNFAYSGNMGFKDRNDVNSASDFWSWMNKGMAPLYFLDKKWVSEDSGLDLGSYSDEEKLFYLNHNRKVAPLRMSQEVVGKVDCQNEELSSKFQMECTKDTALDLTLDPTAFDVSQISFDEAEGKTVFLHDDDYQSVLRDLEANLWLNSNTYRVVISMLTYNANLDLLTMTNVHFMFARSGHVWKEITNRTFKLLQYDSFEVYLWDILFYLHITLLLVNEVRDILSELRARRWHVKKAFKHYIGFWNTVDWVSILMAYIMLIVWLMRYTKVAQLQDTLIGLPGTIATCSSATNQVTCETEIYQSFYQDAEQAGSWIKDSNLLGAFYPIIIMLRLFKAFQAQPRLALVAMTLYNSAGDLAHFTIVFLAAFISFVFTGICLFGQEIADYAQFDRAAMSLFRMLMGDFDYEALQANNRLVAALFVVLFQLTMFLIMLNMLVAIVMDDYSETKRALMHGETLWQEVYQICQRAFENYKGVRISFDVILKSFIRKRGVKCLKSTNVISKAEFMEIVPGLSADQADNIVTSAVQEWGENHRFEVTMPQLLSSASVAAACATATRLAIKKRKKAAELAASKLAEGGLTPGGGMTPGGSVTPPVTSNTVATFHMSEDSKDTKDKSTEINLSVALPTMEEMISNEGLSLQEIFRAAELRLSKDQSACRDPKQVDALMRILQSLQLLSMNSGHGDEEVRRHGVAV